MHVSYRYLRPLPVLFARGVGPYNTSAPQAWMSMRRWLKQRQSSTTIPQGYGFCRDNPLVTAPDQLRYDACIALRPELDPDSEAGIGRQTLRAGAYAVYTHIGSHDEIGELFSRLHREIVPERGLTVDYDRPFVAIYLNDPTVTPEDECRTELCIPVLPIEAPFLSRDRQEEIGDFVAPKTLH